MATWTGRGGCRRSFRLDLLSLSGTEGDMVPSLEYEWQAHAVRRAEALSDILHEGMETGLPTLLSLEGPVAARENATRRYTRENTMESKH